MTVKTDYKLTMLARAEKDGKPIHDLMVLVPATVFTNRTFKPNPDPMALIAAAQKWGWAPEFYLVTKVRLRNTNFIVGQGVSNQAALMDAMFQATAALEPDNWTDCPQRFWNRHLFYGDSCCLSTGKVMKETDGNCG